MALISVVLPTINGRQDVYDFVRGRFERMDYGDHTMEIVPIYGQHTVGIAWQRGAERAQGDYILFGNDDCEPHDGWWGPAIEAVDSGYVPSPMVYDTGGYPQGLPEWGRVAPDCTLVQTALIPFMSKAQWAQIKPLFLGHYYSDNFFTDRAAANGWECVLRTGFAFTHYWAQQGRGAGMGSEAECMKFDRRLYETARLMVAEGRWDKPWPPNGYRA